MRIALVAVPMSLIVAACGGGLKDADHDGIADGVKEPDSVSLVAPSTPIGTVSGQVLTTRLTPLDGAQVTLNLGGKVGEAAGPFKLNTDAEGNFAFAGLPAGAQLQVSITKAGYATVRTTTLVPSTAGNFPINNGNAVIGPFALTQLNGSAKFMVITKTGKPAKGVKATLEASPSATFVTAASGTYGTSFGVVVADGTVDDQGLLSFSGVPAVDELTRLDGFYDVTVQALDENADGVADFLGSFQRFTAQSLLTNPTPRIITLADARSSQALAIAATNIDSVVNAGSAPAKNWVKAGETLYFVFNQPIIDSSLTVKLTDELGVQSLVVSKSLRIGTTLTVTPTTPLDSGKEYNLSIRATSLDNGSTFSRAAYFFVGDPAVPKPFAVSSIQYRDLPPTNSTLNNGETVLLHFNQPIALVGSTPAEAFVDYDFNASGTTGDIPGEKGNAVGFALSPFEPTAEMNTLFSLQPSGYTTRYSFVFTPATVGVPNATMVSVAFGKLLNATNGYQTVWGTPVTSEESSGVILAP